LYYASTLYNGSYDNPILMYLIHGLPDLLM
jgi:hypothetical protein